MKDDDLDLDLDLDLDYVVGRNINTREQEQYKKIRQQENNMNEILEEQIKTLIERKKVLEIQANKLKHILNNLKKKYDYLHAIIQAPKYTHNSTVNFILLKNGVTIIESCNNAGYEFNRQYNNWIDIIVQINNIDYYLHEYAS